MTRTYHGLWMIPFAVMLNNANKVAGTPALLRPQRCALLPGAGFELSDSDRQEGLRSRGHSASLGDAATG